VLPVPPSRRSIPVVILDWLVVLILFAGTLGAFVFLRPMLAESMGDQAVLVIVLGHLTAIVLYIAFRLVVWRGRGVLGTAVAWLIILDLVCGAVYRNSDRSSDDKGGGSAAWLVTMQSQGRYLVGWAYLIDQLNKTSPGSAGKTTRKDLYEQAQALEKGSYSQRLRFATLAGELAGPDEARAALARLERDRKEGKLEARDVSIDAARLLDRLYAGYEKNPKAPPVLNEKEQERLRTGLGWFGELALAPDGGDPVLRERVIAPAVRTAVTYIAVFLCFGGGFLIGLTLLIVALVYACKGQMRSALRCGTGHGGIYAETFALYMMFYLGLSLVAALLMQIRGVAEVLRPFSLLLAAGAMFLSLSVLLWPRLRGIPWRQLRDDLGLRLGNTPRLNVLLGPISYLCALPLLLAGILLILGLAYLLKRFGMGDPFESGDGPSHPIVGVALDRNWWVWLQVFVVASIAAPIVEEIMFRGVLYRHLREASHTWGRRVSVIGSVLFSSFIFAVIHPQGWLGVPVLMALAAVFALVREWRGSLVPPMIAHGLNNGITLLVLLLVAS
jgi:membrane protease YdiL (CAAX protease family)